MAIYEYRAYDNQGHLVNATYEADSEESVKAFLKKDGCMIVSVKKQSSARSGWSLRNKDKLGLSELEFFTAELAVLLQSGVKIDKGLKIIARTATEGAMGRLVSAILNNLKAGKTVAESFDTSDMVFDALYLNLIEIGEKSGSLPQVFSGLAKDLKFRKNLKAKVIQALTYPAIILMVCVACILFVFNYIVPQMGSIFTESDDLPIYTSIMLGASDWMIRYQMWLFAGLALLSLFCYKQKDSVSFKNRLGARLLKIPVLSSLIVQIERIRFNAAMALMLKTGVRVDDAINLAARSVENQVIKNSLQIAMDKVKKGGSVSSSLAMTPIYPDFYISLLEVGEESGELAQIFDEVAERSRTDFESWTDKVTSLIEPLLILVMGGIVGSVVITMLLSVVSVNDISL